jgi:hypothetical protein
MPAPINAYTNSVESSQTVTTTTETEAVRIKEVNTNHLQRQVAITGVVNITVGTGGASVTLRVRRDSVSGTVIGVAQAVTVTAGSTYSLAVQARNEPGEVARATYVVTVTVAGATGNSTINYAYVGATAY